MKFLKAIIIVCLAFANFSCIDPGVKQEMALLDEAFIPLNYYLKYNHNDKIQSSFLLFSKRWEQLKSKYQKGYSNDDWEDTFSRIDGFVDKVREEFSKDDNEQGHLILEDIQFELVNLRQRYGINYYLDYLYLFQSDWKVVLEIVNDPVLCWLEWNEFEDQVNKTSERWFLASNAKIEWETYSFNAKEIDLFHQQIKVFEFTFDCFIDEMECANRETVALAAEQANTNFEKLIGLFGDFSVAKHLMASN